LAGLRSERRLPRVESSDEAFERDR